MNQLSAKKIFISGIVQGVGFRPFVYGLANKHCLVGWVRNTSAGVEIEVNGTPEKIELFSSALLNEAPPLSKIDDFRVKSVKPNSYTSFEILQSQIISDAFQPISPDVSICPDCLNELFNPDDRRYLYPFINCTNCGPRLTIIDDIPYDRPKTTMAAFNLCQPCLNEYHNPIDRRFHAQPIACPDCGPQIWLVKSDCMDPEFNNPDNQEFNSRVNTIATLLEVQSLLIDGRILAIKGLGGFHLACDALNLRAVLELRKRKLRVDKPFALMMPDVETIKNHCYLSESEHKLLISRQRPIVILRRKKNSNLSLDIAPKQETIGVMLPYTPLHYLLFHKIPANEINIIPPTALVMTSGNVSEEPIAFENHEALLRLNGLADRFLLHNRPIRTRCDDSVVFSVDFGKGNNMNVEEKTSSITQPIRRSRGYAPDPIQLPFVVPMILATGAHLKNTFCLTKNQYAFLSHHIGDLENFETLNSFEDGIAHYERLFRIKPEAIAYDLHPDYLATQYAFKRAEDEILPAYGVQHHHAHIVSCLADNRYQKEDAVIGVSFDGTGYGTDGAIWGGEFLLSTYHDFTRVYHLDYFSLPGGDNSIYEPWRICLAWLNKAGIPWDEALPPVQHGLSKSIASTNQLQVLQHQLKKCINTIPTSSMGRLFDAVSALIGIREEINYEAQAAVELEAAMDPFESGIYPWAQKEFPSTNGSLTIMMKVIDPAPLLAAVIQDYKKDVPIPIISARFHNTIAELTVTVCSEIRKIYKISTVALSGGVWQNRSLAKKTLEGLNRNSFSYLVHNNVPCNDGGISLGQAISAAVIHSKQMK